MGWGNVLELLSPPWPAPNLLIVKLEKPGNSPSTRIHLSNPQAPRFITSSVKACSTRCTKRRRPLVAHHYTILSIPWANRDCLFQLILHLCRRASLFTCVDVWERETQMAELFWTRRTRRVSREKHLSHTYLARKQSPSMSWPCAIFHPFILFFLYFSIKTEKIPLNSSFYRPEFGS